MMKLDHYVFTHIGGREENQDSVGLTETESGGIFVVADGLGGHQHGHLASAAVVDAVLKNWNPDTELSPEDSASPDAAPAPADVPDRLQTALREKVEQANKAVLDLQAEVNATCKSTVVALAIDNHHAAWANTGDSRLYYIHNGSFAKISDDHSVAFAKYRAGEINRAQIATDEDQPALLRVLGGNTRWEPDLAGIDTLCAGDAFLLCSDGVWEHILDEEILVDCLKAGTAREWAELMLLRIVTRLPGNHDNLSLLTVMLH